MRRSQRVLLAGVGPGGDPAGAVGLARALRDAGWEVVHLGEVADAAVVAAVARDEDADAVVVLAADEGQGGLVSGVEAALESCGLAGIVVLDAGIGTAAVVDALGAIPGST